MFVQGFDCDRVGWQTTTRHAPGARCEQRVSLAADCLECGGHFISSPYLQLTAHTRHRGEWPVDLDAWYITIRLPLMVPLLSSSVALPHRHTGEMVMSSLRRIEPRRALLVVPRVLEVGVSQPPQRTAHDLLLIALARETQGRGKVGERTRAA